MPDEAGIGLTPHSAAKADSDLRRPGLAPAVMRSAAAALAPTPKTRRSAGAPTGRGEAGDLAEEGCDLLAEVLIAACDGAQGELCGVGDLACPNPVVGICMCHGDSYCQEHSRDHQMYEGFELPFDEIVSRAEVLAERLGRKQGKALSDLGIRLARDELRSFAGERGLTGFWQTVFDEIHGQEVMKRCLAAGIFSAPDDPVHVLAIDHPMVTEAPVDLDGKALTGEVID